MKKILIVGTGGHGKVVLDCILARGEYAVVEFATNAEHSERFCGYPVHDESALSLSDIATKYDAVTVAIGDNKARLQKIDSLLVAGAIVPPIIHPSSSVSLYSEIGDGTQIMAFAVVNASARIGRGCIINTAAIVEHDCILGDGVHMSPQTSIGGGTSIGSFSWLCIGSTMSDHIKATENVVLGAGSTLIKDAEVAGLYVGSPANLKRACSNG